MKPKRLLWQLYPSYLLVTLISLAAIGWYALSSMQQFYYNQVKEDLKASARIIQDQVLESYEEGDLIKLDKLCTSLSVSGQRRITVIETSGKVVAESRKDPEEMKRMDDHSDRPEIIAAMKDQPGSDIRFSNTLGVDMMYVAIPLKDKERIAAVLRIAKPVSSINAQLDSIYDKIFFGSLMVAVAAALLSLIVSRKISKPLVELKNGARLFAGGDLSHKLPVGNCYEIDAVAKAMNLMAAEIDERISTISRQRNEHKAVLSSMSEAVLAFNSDCKLITLNDSAAKIIGFDISDAKGRSLQEIIRNPALQQFVTYSLDSDKPLEENITLHKDGIEYFLQARSNALLDEQGQKIGILVVLNDITRIRQLEKVRSDFVANVSHELKTPITSIKGFVETLLEGAMQEPDERKRFLEIIANQSNRMDAIIDDLLELSRIEQQAEKKQIKLESGEIKDMLVAAIDLCHTKAQKKHIEVELKCPDSIVANINSALLEQAVLNLLDNAIKYSPENSSIEVNARRSDEHISISVTDFGCGIDAKSQPRLFERFFRVDKARSRKLGGTGLGLAIVKHIVEAHNGTVEVESKVGKGSKFIIKLPV